MQTELLDYFDEDIKHLGIASREQVHTQGLWHKTFHCWLIGLENGQPYLIFQQRSTVKHSYPSKLDITAAGHLLAGESPEVGSRELTEELGIDFDFNELVFLGIQTGVSIDNQYTNKEFCYTYFLHRELPLTAYNLQTEEVLALYKISLEDGFRLFAKEVSEIEAEYFCPILDKHTTFRKSIQKNDLLPHADNYYLKILIMAERYLEGKKYLAI